MKANALHIPALMGLLACLSACSSLQGKQVNGVYTSPDGEFSVMVPRVLDVETTDGVVGPSKRFVDFSMGPYWTAEGAYSVEWYKLGKLYATDADFIKDTREFLPSLVADSVNPSFKPQQTEDIQVNGHPAVRLVAEGVDGGIDAYWVATSIDFGDRIAISIMLVPKRDEPRYYGPPSSDAAPLYGSYPAFTNSITRH
ncbi:MAG TPA: hypothetical protein VGM16_02080 [Gammaproteobacteria bacterium]